MRSIVFFILLLGGCANAGITATAPSGDWYSTDFRGLEVASNQQMGICLRIWLEERAYSFVQHPSLEVAGYYRNVMRSVPVGPVSFRPECTFGGKAASPIAMQGRVWAIAGRSVGSDAWKIRTEPRPGTGLSLYETKDFETTLSMRGNRLVDNDSANPEVTLTFRPAGSQPAAAREALEDAMQRVHNGHCLEVMSGLGFTSQQVADFCETRQRLEKLSGRYVAVQPDQVVQFDRAPLGFPQSSAQLHPQSGFFFAFVTKYEKQQSPGNAVVFEEGGKWRVVALWF